MARAYMGGSVNVSTPLANCELNVRSERAAGPFTTPPLVLKREPWHGQTNVVPENPVTVHPSCVHVAVNTEKVVASFRVAR